MADTISINKEEFEELKRLYAKAAPGEVFLFKGKEVLKEYAKYLIEFLEPKFGNQQRGA